MAIHDMSINVGIRGKLPVHRTAHNTIHYFSLSRRKVGLRFNNSDPRVSRDHFRLSTESLMVPVSYFISTCKSPSRKK